MWRGRILLAILAGLFAAHAGGQSGAVWETLMQAPLPEDAEPKLSVFSIPVGPAPAVPRAPGRGHRHAGPVFAYILQGEIENQVEPDPPQVYKAGGFFYEAPMHLHKFLRNVSTAESAKLIVFQAGNTGTPVPAIKLLLQEPLNSTVNQELSLSRLTIPAGASAEAHGHSGPGIVYVLDGSIARKGAEEQPKSYRAGDLFPEPADSAEVLRKISDSAPAKILLYEVSEKR